MKRLIIATIILVLSAVFSACISYAINSNHTQNEIIINNIVEEKNETKIEVTNESKEITTHLKSLGVLEIPKINLKAEVKDGTTNDVINEYIGHFQSTSLWFGNIALCAHNNGYSKNHFARLNELVKGDEITYSTKYGKRTYIVEDIQEISKTNVEVLENSEENRLTLITCITNQPEKRLCITAIEGGNK